MTDQFNVIIPARLDSSRLARKVLADIGGKPMIQWVWEAAKAANAKAVYIATDSTEVKSQVEAFGGHALLTHSDHPSGTDRITEAANLLQLDDSEIIVNLQGDEPLMPPKVIHQVAKELLSDNQVDMASLSTPINTWKDLSDPNIVKLITDRHHRAIYFSRAIIPWDRDKFNAENLEKDKAPNLTENKWHKHLGIYAYRAGFLRHYVSWPVAPLEQVEKLEQLRVLWQGKQIRIGQACEAVPGGVDTQADLDKVRQLILTKMDQ